MNRVRFFLPIITLLALSQTFTSCAVFEAIGDSLSQFYENSISYFNAYYNAKRNFNEAEDALRAAEMAARGKTTADQRSAPLATTVRDKFNAVIDKCSSILSFYPKSALVDDALLLIGKSYYYLQDYLKAERKFSELLVQYPNSELVLESHLWLARTLEKINRSAEARQVALRAATDAVEKKEPGIASQAYELLGDLALQDKVFPSAIEYYSKAAETADNDFLAATNYVKLGDVYSSLKEYEKAVTAYIKVYNLVSDPYLDYYGRLQAARGYAALKRYDTALFLTNEMLDDFRYASYHPSIRLEHAAILLTSGRTEEALDEYQFLDTSYVRVEAGAHAALALAQYYEEQMVDYEKALHYYSRASSVQGLAFSELARRRERSLGRLIVLQRELFVNDSLVALSDSVLKYPEKFLQPPEGHEVDSLQSPTDSLATKAQKPPEPFKPVKADSMRVAKARIAYDLGEVFYSELDLSDSAAVWFQRALDWKVDSTRIPRALFILAQLEKTNGKKTETEIAQLYQTIVNDFPKSPYADEARNILGLAVTSRGRVENDSAYAVAESLIWAGKYEAAIERLRSIVEENAGASIAAKSQYAIGWIYENYLGKPDSALICYKLLVDQFKSSPYALAVMNKISDILKDEQKGDAKPVVPPPDQKETKVKLDENDETPLRLRTQEQKRSKQDTVKTKIRE